MKDVTVRIIKTTHRANKVMDGFIIHIPCDTDLSLRHESKFMGKAPL